MTTPGALPIQPAASLRARPAASQDPRASSGASPFAGMLDYALAADRWMKSGGRAQVAKAMGLEN